MTLKASTGLRDKLLVTDCLKAIMDGGKINIYGGAVPATADDALGSATLLCAITLNSTGTGITFDTTAVNGVLAKTPSEVWSGVNVASGTATFYRHVAAGDTGALSTTQPRIQGEIGTAGKEINLSSVNLVAGQTRPLDYYSVSIPTL